MLRLLFLPRAQLGILGGLLPGAVLGLGAAVNCREPDFSCALVRTRDLRGAPQAPDSEYWFGLRGVPQAPSGDYWLGHW